ncbi:MAG: hypothetical protein Q9218_005480 [Villophora microphyllina]
MANHMYPSPSEIDSLALENDNHRSTIDQSLKQFPQEPPSPSKTAQTTIGMSDDAQKLAEKQKAEAAKNASGEGGGEGGMSGADAGALGDFAKSMADATEKGMNDDYGPGDAEALVPDAGDDGGDDGGE